MGTPLDKKRAEAELAKRTPAKVTAEQQAITLQWA
jgi:hypothetical protein